MNVQGILENLLSVRDKPCYLQTNKGDTYLRSVSDGEGGVGGGDVGGGGGRRGHPPHIAKFKSPMK